MWAWREGGRSEGQTSMRVWMYLADSQVTSTTSVRIRGPLTTTYARRNNRTTNTVPNRGDPERTQGGLGTLSSQGEEEVVDEDGGYMQSGMDHARE